MSTPVPDVVTRYFEADDRRDVDAIIALFTDDAVVLDEGQTYRGTTEIRGLLERSASEYQYTTEVIDTKRTGEDGYVVTARLDGNFPGGTAQLKFRFTIAGDRIVRLEIAP